LLIVAEEASSSSVELKGVDNRASRVSRGSSLIATGSPLAVWRLSFAGDVGVNRPGFPGGSITLREWSHGKYIEEIPS